MIIQDILTTAKPKLVTLTDSSSVTWNFSSGNVAFWTLGGNNTLTISNLPTTPTFGVIKITQGGSGNFTATLGGNVDAVTWKLNAADVNWMSFSWDGTILYWGSLYSASLPQLSAPGSFTANVISGTEIDLTWASVTNATSYTVQRAADSGFTTSLTTIYTGSGTSFNDTGLTIATTYYYRVKATATAYRDSVYSTTSASTTGGLIAVTGWSSFTQSPTGTWTSPSSPGFDKASQTMTGDGYFQCDLATTSNSLVLIGLDTSSTTNSVVDGSVHAQWTTAVYIASTAGNHYTVYAQGENSGNALDTGILYTVGDKQRIRRTFSTGALVAEKSSDGGTTWTTVHTYTATSTATLYLKCYISNNSNKLLNPKGSGIS